MRQTRSTRIAVVALAAMTLQGCVAAAIPALAGAALVRTQTDGDDGRDEEPAVADAAAEAATLSQAPETNAEPAPAPATEPEFTAPPASIPADGSGRVKAVIIGPAPPPSGARSGAPDGAPTAPQPLNSAFRQLITYASDYVSANAPSGTPESAILKDPISLSPVRQECYTDNPTVLIDLDSETDGPGPITAAANPALGQALQSLREKGVDIAWISKRSAGLAGDIRIALKRSEIDPDARDTLLLMRYPSDRKQIRRDDLAKASCIIAIAGDNRDDFHELYEYLIDPTAAAGLEALIGDGWFLVPPVLGEAE